MQSYELPTTDNWRLATGNCFLPSVNWPLDPNFIVHKNLRANKVLYNSGEIITDVMGALQILLFMQNKAKFRKVKLNVSQVLTRDYGQMDTWSIRKKQSQTNPNKAKTNPILVNKTTIRTQFKPKQTQFHNPVCLRSRILPLNLLNTPINRTCCVYSSYLSLDSAKMALYKGNWNFNKYGRKKLNLLTCKRLSRLSLLLAPTGTLFALSYVGIFVLNN